MSNSSIRILLFADTHLGFDYPIRPRLQRRRRGPDFFANFRRVLDHARETRPDFVVHGGDLFFRARVPQPIVDMVYQDLLEFSAEGIPLLIVLGNHERSVLPTSLFLNHPDIHIFDRPRSFLFEIGDAKIAFSGFPCERKAARDQFLSLVAKTGFHDLDTDIKLLCMHQTVEGAQVGPSDYTFRKGKDVICRRDLPKDALGVLCGHIHRRQVLGQLDRCKDGLPPVIYPGSTERTSFAERAEPKGFYELEFSPLADDNWAISHLNFIELPARPMEDLILDHNITPKTLEAAILAQIAQFDQDAIVRINGSPDLHPQVKTLVTSQFLRQVLPDSMNFQFGQNFRTWRNDQAGSVEDA
jgi:DNA repair exonuclease SbcCD nuclease subunit